MKTCLGLLIPVPISKLPFNNNNNNNNNNNGFIAVYLRSSYTSA